MRNFLLALILLSIPVSSGAIAQQRSGTPEEQKACNRDVQRFFRPVIDRIPVEEIQGFLEGAIARKVGY